MSKKLLYILILSLIACCIEVDISVPSLPDISDYFDISDGLTQMTIAVNFLGFCISAAIYGPLSDSFGRKKIMLAGNGLMFIGAFGCTISSSIEFLLISRFIQGLGASASAVIVFAIIADVCAKEKMASIIGQMNSILTVFMSIAPIAGGFINEYFGWRTNYGVVFLVSVISWFFLIAFLPETKEDTSALSLRKITKDYTKLLLSLRFIIISLVPSLMFAGYMSFITCAPFMYMETFGIPMMHYAIHQGFIIGTFSLVSQFSGDIKNFLGERICVISGIILLLIGNTMLFTLGVFVVNNPYLTSLSMILGSAGAAISYPLIFAKSFDIFPEIKGTASSALMSIRMLITASVIAFTAYIYDGSLFKVASLILFINLISATMTVYIAKVIEFTD